MIDFSTWLNLPLVWGGIIALVVFLYVVLDGFDLGCGILFPFAPSDKCRNRMMNSIAPFWDGNETWLVLGGGGLFVAFPHAYAILLPAFYIPIILMLMGLIFRGVAFEFRFKASDLERKLWDVAFHGGSLLATFMQGVILGNFIQGIKVVDNAYAGGALSWANGFSIMIGIFLIFGYALLAASWLIMKTQDETQKWARKVARYVIAYVALGMVIVTITMPFIDKIVTKFWFTMPNTLYLLPLPIITAIVFAWLWYDLYHEKAETRPFVFSLLLFGLSYLGFSISLYPWIVPYQLTLSQAAAVPTSLSIMLIGVVIMLPIILAYTIFNYYIFRGKTDHEPMY